MAGRLMMIRYEPKIFWNSRWLVYVLAWKRAAGRGGRRGVDCWPLVAVLCGGVGARFRGSRRRDAQWLELYPSSAGEPASRCGDRAMRRRELGLCGQARSRLRRPSWRRQMAAAADPSRAASPRL